MQKNSDSVILALGLGSKRPDQRRDRKGRSHETVQFSDGRFAGNCLGNHPPHALERANASRPERVRKRAVERADEPRGGGGKRHPLCRTLNRQSGHRRYLDPVGQIDLCAGQNPRPHDADPVIPRRSADLERRGACHPRHRRIQGTAETDSAR